MRTFLVALIFSLTLGGASALADQGQLPPIVVEWQNSYWPATVLWQLPDGRAVIHYTGYGEEFDEVVRPARIHTLTRSGNRAMVEWQGSYWPATILQHLPDGSARIHYDGWGPEWDETVPPARLVALGPTPKL